MKNFKKIYSLEVENTTNQIIRNVELFDAFTKYNSKPSYFNEKGIFKKNDVVIKSINTNKSYQDIIGTLADCPEINKIEYTYIESENELQLKEFIKFKYSDINGYLFGKDIFPLSTKDQIQKNIACYKDKYILSGFSSIILTKLHPFTKLNIYFYENEKDKDYHKYIQSLYKKMNDLHEIN
jgi:hypothetical protein